MVQRCPFNAMIAFACLAAVPCAALTQTPSQPAQPTQPTQPTQPGQRSPLRPIDPGVADVNPLSESFRDMRVDLRQPVGFENVYRVPGRDDLLMRSSGALTAVFPQSAYVQTQRGPVPIIPAGTVFYIGEPPRTAHRPPVMDDDEDALEDGAMSKRIRNRHNAYVGAATDAYIDTHADDRRAVSPPAATGERMTQPDQMQMQRIVPDMSRSMEPTMATDERYRTQRIAELMAKAADAVRSRPGGP